MALQQVESGRVKEHGGYLAVITTTSIACHDDTGQTCQNLSGMTPGARNQGQIRPADQPARGPSGPDPFERSAARRSASATASSSDPKPGGLTTSIETPASGPSATARVPTAWSMRLATARAARSPVSGSNSRKLVDA